MQQWWVVPGPNGGLSELRAVESVSPGPNEVLVEVKGAAINRGELIGRPALVSSNPKARATPSGIEFAGLIAAVGTEVVGWSEGDRVMGRGSGCHAEFTTVAAAALMGVPSDLSFEEAAAIPNVFVTAHDAMVTAAEIRAGESVLITAGSSGVGTAAIQIARKLGATTIIATSRSADKAEALRSLGATDVVLTNEPGWADEVRTLTTSDGATGGIDVVIDQVGGELFAPSLQTMAIAGRYVTVGRNGDKLAEIDLDLVARQRLRLIGVTFRTRSPAEALACSARFVDHLLPAFDDGSLRAVLDRTFPLRDLPIAHDYMRSDRQIGKIVLVP